MLRRSYVASFAVAGVASLAVISGAQADGYEPVGKAIAAPVADYAWGLYVGVGVGGAQFDNSVDFKGKSAKQHQHCHHHCYKNSNWYDVWRKYDWKHGSASSGDDDWNVFGTMQVGYDHLMGKRFLIGVFADYDFFPQSDNSITTKLNGRHRRVGHVRANLDLEGIWNAGGKLGFLVAPHWAIYGAGGYSEARIDGSAHVHIYGRPAVELDLKDELQGWFLEAGSEVKVHRNVGFKFAYRYQQFDDLHASGHAVRYGEIKHDCHDKWKCRNNKVTWADTDVDTEIHSIRATLVIGLTPEERTVVPLK